MRPADRPLGVREAYDALDHFGRKAGRVRLLLLLHACVPQSFRADLLNLLKVNFVGAEAGADLTIDADVIVSDLVHPAAAGYYRLDPEVRRHGLALLDATYREQKERRSVQVARFMLAYAESLERRGSVSLDAMLSEYLAVQRWVALAFIDPAAAAQAFARAIQESTQHATVAARFRLSGVTAAVSVPLSGHQELLAYARGVQAIAAGDVTTAERLLDWQGDEELRVGEVTLRPARTLLRRAGGPLRQSAVGSAPTPPVRIGVPDPIELVGRSAQLSRLRELLTSRETRERLMATRTPAAIGHAAVISLVAVAGGGKSTLAGQAVADPVVARHFTHGIVWLDGEDAAAFAAALTAYAAAVGIEGLVGPDGLVDADRFREVFADRRALFVTPAEAMRAIMPVLYAAGPDCVVLRSMERPPTDPTFAITLPPFDPRETAAFLSSVGGGLPDLAGELTDFAEGNPLLLRLLAHRAKATPRAEILARLRRFGGANASTSGVPVKVEWLVRMAWATSATVVQHETSRENFADGVQQETARVIEVLHGRTHARIDELGVSAAAIQYLTEAGLLTRSGATVFLHRLVRDALLAVLRPASKPKRARFELDVFISYAHVDNLELTEGRQGWVSNFHRALQIRLAQVLGREVRVWRDDKLSANDIFDEHVVERVANAAVFICVLSPRYVKSQFTQQELNAFLRSADEHDDLVVGTQSRLVKVLKQPVPLSEQPRELQSMLGYEFFMIDPGSGRVRELTPEFGPEAEREFWLKLDDLAHDVVTLLESVGNGGADSPGEERRAR
jgi:hypothetical protein